MADLLSWQNNKLEGNVCFDVCGHPLNVFSRVNQSQFHGGVVLILLFRQKMKWLEKCGRKRMRAKKVQILEMMKRFFVTLSFLFFSLVSEIRPMRTQNKTQNEKESKKR